MSKRIEKYTGMVIQPAVTVAKTHADIQKNHDVSLVFQNPCLWGNYCLKWCGIWKLKNLLLNKSI